MRTLFVCQGTGCVSSKSPEIQVALEKLIEEANLEDIKVKLTGCHGFCQQGPIIIIEPEGIFYGLVGVDDVAEIVESHLINGKQVERLFYKEPVTGKAIPKYEDIPFYSKQERIVLKNCGTINSEDIEDYIEVDGYKAMEKALEDMIPDEVIEEVKASGLRGRGGAGFPTGLKWQFCRDAKGDQKYLICNADEGDPGAFMDRSILEATPHSVIEGMVIAGYAFGATKGYIYVRAEYPLAIKRLKIAIDQARERGYLGENILDSGHDFDLILFEGAGAFVCGEETALMASIEGKRGMPRPRPPYPAVSGLFGKPTTINNVKSLSLISPIILKGAEWFASIGTEKSKGTAVFALTGNISNSGLIEVPMGTTLREIIYGIGGGILDGKQFKAVQSGGPSGGCLPASHLDTPVDYENMAAVGSIMGSGGMVVMDEDTCMVDVARYFLDFTQKESCGECGPCRLGTKQMLDILTDITEGKGKPTDIDLLLELSDAIKTGSLCALGQTAPNPVLTTIRYFREEYEAHIKEGRCPALVCKELIDYKIDAEKCVGCHLCFNNCPVDAITGDVRGPHVIEMEKCIKCGMCLEVCPENFSAVDKISKGIEQEAAQ
ncbi:NADH-quinone oxidoreductase subunit NuoF [Candidatus Bathyarchaeota archaeon]|jgi:NADH:ubiquinone oxidoreductase subunit F (NADH-binding)/(2Fe-2S) ferredoxin/NAD-dependent dihydropyrimidine dehydrogenase PreA subunit|nr:NADH-quinone oxidoreductase subunit NuoF [Candidatus Bathyarchaeota archaeon]MBT4319534.1 NADH-quinone oxidoreductase subunit NuoF [Candidatus Bathyarchaeota archaeon]MBT4422739.1 NADH-quinone oxidoreductase subunit NuoF [Candidatus Bathyarchaeota archaeon]MBT6603479.1 NADH-quinone oxidoreductase subunit NuoF [Candidatus Bathyarchaeota archaeon]MBT7186213.1 NADH-quinone oxidoreductase subunit NuoF [Candidatus Bathyarchaeota archaeon]